MKITEQEPNLFEISEQIPQELREQVNIVQESLERDVHLAKVLQEKQLQYDDLLYLDNHRPAYSKQKIYTLDDFTQEKNDIPVVSFFSGAGGIDLGFEAAGYGHELLVEKIDLFCVPIYLKCFIVTSKIVQVILFEPEGVVLMSSTMTRWANAYQVRKGGCS
jgi:hypothetical protein